MRRWRGGEEVEEVEGGGGRGGSVGGGGGGEEVEGKVLGGGGGEGVGRGEEVEGDLLGGGREVRRLRRGNQPRIGGRDREGSRWGTDEGGGERKTQRVSLIPTCNTLPML